MSSADKAPLQSIRTSTPQELICTDTVHLPTLPTSRLGRVFRPVCRLIESKTQLQSILDGDEALGQSQHRAKNPPVTKASERNVDVHDVFNHGYTVAVSLSCLLLLLNMIC